MLRVQSALGEWETPAWLTIDRLLVDLLHEYRDGLCPGCGEPLTSHAGKTYKDYSAAAVTCPALIAQDKAQTAQAKRDGRSDAKTDPERARSWVKGPRAQISGYVAWVRDQLKQSGGGRG